MSSKGAWNEWLIYFLNGVAVQAEDVLSRAQRINTLIDKWQISIGGSSSTPINIIKLLAVNPYLTTKKTSNDLNVAFTTAQRAISKLEEKKIITQTNDSKRDKVYCATEILEILEEPAKINSDQIF